LTKIASIDGGTTNDAAVFARERGARDEKRGARASAQNDARIDATRTGERARGGRRGGDLAYARSGRARERFGTTATRDERRGDGRGTDDERRAIA